MLFDRRLREWLAAERPRVYGAVLLAVLVPGGLLAASATYILRRQMEQSSSQEGRQVALSAAAAVHSTLASTTNYLQAFASRRRLRTAMKQGDTAEIARHLEDALELHPRFLFISTYRPDGTMTAIHPPDPIVGRNYGFREWYQGLAGGWKPYISQTYRTDVSPQPLVSAVAVPVFDDAGRPLGILMAAYQVETLAEIIRDVSSAGGWNVSVLDQSKKLVTGSGSVAQQFDPSMIGGAWGQPGVGFVELPGETSLTAYAPVAQLGWAVIAEQPAASVFRPLRILQQQLLLYGLICFVMGAAGVVLLAGLYGELDAARRFFDLSAELFCTADFQGRFTRLNRAWETLLGMPLEQLLATPFLEFVHPEDRDATLAESRKLAAGGRTVHFENRYRAADGSYRWLQWSCASVVQNQTIYAVAKDVTESKNVARMKDEFVSTVSHELRTPLASLRGFAELMIEREFPEARRREFLEIIRRESTRLAGLINDFLDLQRIEAGRQELRLQARDLLPVLRQSVETFAGFSDHHRLVLELPASLPRITCDADRTAQVLYNLISNAIKYSPLGGDINVGARCENREALVWVRDCGLGIPESEVDKLFTKFHRVDSSAHREIGGTGLGLALVKQLVELQGGRVWVVTALGEGSTFYFTLPLASQPALPSSPAPCLPEQAPDILMVEDDAAFSNLLRTHFEALGLRVASTSHAEVALQWLQGVRPGVILLDILLPGMSGWEFLMNIKNDEKLKTVPVIVVTVSEPNGRGLVLAGAEYISKTVAPDSLVLAIQSQLAGGKGKRVLVVDDDPLLRSTLSEHLRRRLDGLVEVAANGLEALEIMRVRMPDLLVLDLLMPVMDGFELLRHLRQDSRAVDLQVVVLTGKDLSEQETDYIRQRLACLVGKREMQLDYFTQIVGRALGRQLQADAPANSAALFR